MYVFFSVHFDSGQMQLLVRLQCSLNMLEGDTG